MTTINTCLDNNQVFLYGMTADRLTVSNTTFSCYNLITCLKLLCEVSNIHNVDMTCFMLSPGNTNITRVIYTEDEYDKRFILFLCLVLYFIITISIIIFIFIKNIFKETEELKPLIKNDYVKYN